MDKEINNNPNSDRSAAVPDRSIISDAQNSLDTLTYQPNPLGSNEQGSLPGQLQSNAPIDATSGLIESQPGAQFVSSQPPQNRNTIYSNGGAKFADKRSKRKITAIIICILLILLLIGGLFIASIMKKDEQPTTANSNKTVTNLSNEDLLSVTTDPGLSGASKVTVNGPLQVRNNLVVSPSARPDKAEAGQLYFDQNTRQFTYYDGENFQTLVSNLLLNQFSEMSRSNAGAGLLLANGTLNNTGVLSLQGQTGDVSFNSGAGIGVNGTTIANTGVLSLQGSTGNVNLTAGSGIALNGLQVTNTGVTALTGTTGQVNVSAASGSIVLSLPQSIAPGAAPTFAGLTLGSALGIGSGGTGNTSYNNNGVIYFDGTKFVSTPTPAAGLCLISNGSGTPVFGSCTGSTTVTSLNGLSGGINLIAGAGVTVTTIGNDLQISAPAASGVTSLNGLNGALTVANASAAGSIITINDATTSSKGIAQFTTGDFSVASGVVSLGAAVTKQGNSFNGPNQLVLLDSSGFLPALNGSLLGSLNASNITSGTLSVARGGTGAGNFNLNGILYGNGTSAIQSTAAGTTGQCLVVNGSGVPVFGTCTGAGGVSSLNTKTGPVTIQGGTAIAVDNSGANIVLNNTGVTQLLGTANQVIVSSATGAITLSLPQAIGLTSNVAFNQMTLGQNGSSAGRLVLNGSTSNSVSLVAPASPSSGLTFTLPSADGVANQCLQTNGAGQLSFGTCLGGGSGGGISGSGSTNQLAKFTNGQTIGNSNISDDGTVVTVSSGAAIQGSAGLFLGTSGVAGNISLSDGSGNSTSLRAASTGSDLTFVLPNSTGANGQCIKTDGSGNLSFGNCLGGGSGGGVDSVTGSAGGSVAASGPITINDALTSGSTITINTASNSIKGIASFSSSSFDVTAGAVTIKNDGVALGTQTTGNYVASIAAGNGIQGSGASEGSTPTIALGPLTSDWNQSGAFDIVLANANAGIKIMGNSGVFYGSIDVANLTADRTYTFPDSSGTVCLTSGNCIGSGGGVSSTGTDGHIALFDGSSYVIADSIISQAGGAINVAGALTATSFQGNGSAISNLNAGNITTGTLATGRGGTGVDASAAANGQLLIGNGSGFSLATLTAGTGIVIANTAGGINISAPDSGTCSGCAGSDDVVNSLTGSAGGSAAIKGILTINDALTSGSTITINTASNSVKGIASFSSSFFDVASGVVSIKNDSIALGTNTTGNYVAGVNGGNGLTVTGSGTEGASIGLAINLQANKGLEVDGNGLSLIDCATNQVLKYNVSGQWACATDSAGGDGVNAIGVLDSLVKSVNGAVVNGSDLVLQTADALRPGLVSTGTQTFAGAKTFNSTVGVAGVLTAGSFQGDGSGITLLNASNVSSGVLGTAYGGTGLNGSTAANGQLLIGNGAGFGLATLTQGAGIVITNSAGGITISAPDSGTCSGCAGANDVVNSVTGSAGGSATIKGILTINDALTSGSAITINTATTAVKGIASFNASYFDVSSGAVSIKDDSIALGTKTTGNYVAGVAGGDGLTVTGTGEGANVDVNLNIQANKGLIADSSGLGLINCTTDQILKYTAGGQWICAADGAGSGVTGIGTIDSQAKSVNGAVISGNNLILQTADATNAGLVSINAQTFAGAKTFNDLGTFTNGLTVSNNSNFTQTGSGTFSTGTGSISLNGDTTIANNKTLTANGTALFKSATNSATALQIQNSGGAPLLTADTINQRVVIGTGGTPTSQLFVAGTVPTSASGSVSTGASSGPTSVSVQGNYAYVTNSGSNTMAVYNVSNPASPVSVGSVSTGANPNSVSVQGNYAYVTNSGSDTMTIYNISNPASPTSVGSVSTGAGSSPTAISVQGRYVYVASNSPNSTVIIDVFNPAAPTVIGNAPSTTGYVWSLDVDGSYLYMVGASNRVSIYDISNPRVPVSISSVSSGVSDTRSITIQDHYAYVSGISGGTRIFNVSNPASPVFVGSMLVNLETPQTASIQGRYVYLMSYGAVRVFDISNPASPVSLGTITTGGSSTAIYTQGRYVYVTNANTNTLSIYDMGGAYIQQLEVGGIQTSTVRSNGDGSFGGNVSIQGGLGVGSDALISGSLGVGGSASFTGGLTVLGTIQGGIINATTELQTGGTSRITSTGTLQNINTAILRGVSGQSADILNIRDGDAETTIQVKTDGTLRVSNNSSANKVVISTGMASASYNTFEVTANGKLKFGPGVGDFTDTTLYRSNVNTLTTDGSFILNGTGSNLTVQGTGTSSIAGTLNVVSGGLQTAGTLRLSNAGVLQNVSITPNSTVKVGTTGGILYTDASGTIQSLSLVGQNNNCVGLSALGVVQFQSCSGSGGGSTGFENGGSNFTGGNGTTATIRLTGNSYNSTLTNPVLGLSSNSDLDILTNNTSRIRVTAGGNVQILSSSGNSTEQFVVRNVSTGSAASTVYALRVDTSSDTFGRVGIGLLTGNAPQVRLDIGGNAASTGSTANGGLQVWASAAPGLSVNASPGAGAVMSGRIYFDETTGKFKVSENGGAWVNMIQTAGSAPILVGGNNGQNGSGGGGILTIGNTNANSSNTGTYGLLLGTANNNGTISSGIKIDYNGNYLFDRPYTDNDQYGFKIAGNGTGANGALHVDTRYNVVAVGDISTNSTSSYGKFIVEGGAMITGGIRVGTGSEDIGLTLACSSSQQTVDSPQFKNGILVKHNGCRANNSDLAEAYNNNDNAQPGELVMMSMGSSTTVDRATSDKNTRLMGIVSTAPGQTLGTAQVPNGKPIALSGRVPTKVNTEGGVINVGDKITISSIPGVGKKATGRGMVVGTAMETFSSSGVGSIEVFVGTSYYDPTDGNNLQADAANFGDINVSGQTTLKNLTVTGNAVFQGNITVSGHIISAGNTPTVTSSTGATATVDGTDTAGTVTLTVATPVAAGSVSNITFSSPFDKAPRVNLTPDNAAAAAIKYYTNGRTTTGFDIAVGEELPVGVYMYNYQVIQ